jgi:site-specific recombinase XerD
MHAPYYSRTKKAWFLKVTLPNGVRSQTKLGENRTEAFEKFRRMQEAADKSASLGPQVSTIFSDFVLWAEREVAEGRLKPLTLDGYLRYLARFAKGYGELHIGELAPHHVTEWIAAKGWKTSSERAAIAALKVAFNWAAREKRIASNPIQGIGRPASQRRTHLINRDDHSLMIARTGSHAYAGKIDRQFRLVLVAIKQCGGRPQDVAQARVEFVDPEVTKWTLPEHKTRRHTDAPRVVYLSPCLRTITRLLIAGRTSGPLFRGRRGGLTVNAMTCRMKRLRRNLGLPEGTVAYAYRHSYITDALLAGVDVATVAALTGTSIGMIQRHYGHIGKHDEHLRQAAAKAVSK